MTDGATYNAGWEMGRKQGLREAAAEIELLGAAFCVAVGRAATDADVNGEPMMLAVAHAQRVSGLEGCFLPPDTAT